jgi:hypothetical protein
MSRGFVHSPNTEKGGTEVGAFYWTVLAPEIVNSRREEQVLLRCRRHREFSLPVNCPLTTPPLLVSHPSLFRTWG